MRSSSTRAHFSFSTWRHRLRPASYLRGMERHQRVVRKMLVLNRLDILRQEEGLTLEQRHATEHEIPVVRIVLIAGLVQVQQVHGSRDGRQK